MLSHGNFKEIMLHSNCAVCPNMHPTKHETLLCGRRKICVCNMKHEVNGAHCDWAVSL